MSYRKVKEAALATIDALICRLKVDAKEHARDLKAYANELADEITPWKEFENYKHPSEEQHRSAKQFNWRAQNRVGGLTLIAAIAAAVLAGLTFYESKRQADAARGQLDLAKSQEIKQLRAYVGVDPVNIDNFIVGSHPVANVSVSNYGQTPALNFAGKIEAHVLPYMENIATVVPVATKAPNPLSAVGDVFQGHPLKMFTVRTDIVSPEDYRDIVFSKTKRYYVIGSISQTDVFGGQETKYFCFAYFTGEGSTSLDQYSYCQGNYNYSSYTPPPQGH